MAGQIVKRGDRNWLLRIYQGRDVSGKRRYFNKTVRGTKKEAQAELNALIREQDLGALRKPDVTELSAHIDNWFEAVAKRRVRQRTLDDYRDIVARYVLPQLGRIPLARLSPSEIQKHYLKLSDSGLSPQTVRHAHAVLNNALETAVRWQLLPNNPCSYVDLPRVRRREMSVLSSEEAKRFIEATKLDPHHALFVLLVTTGMRPGEALALRWSDVDLERGRIHIQRSLAGRNGRVHFEEPKTPRSRRTVPLPATVTELLRDRRAQDGEDNVVNIGLVFANSRGGPLDLSNVVKRHFKPALERAGLPKAVRLYDLRHSCATILLQAGLNPKIVSERLGHASITLTLDTYSHVLPDMQESAAERMESALFSGGTL